jgi:hypothetical protein
MIRDGRYDLGNNLAPGRREHCEHSLMKNPGGFSEVYFLYLWKKDIKKKSLLIK